MTWVQEALDDFLLTSNIEGYLYGRGATEELVDAMGFCTWGGLTFDVPDPVFRERYGNRGENLEGCLVTPLYSPTSTLLGFQARDVKTKRINRYLLPRAAWVPVWIGIRQALDCLWAGGNVWVVEGLFDLFALRWIVPEGDAVLASITAKLSKKQVQFLQRLRPFVNMVYDHDEGGRKGVHGYLEPDTGREVWGALRKMRAVGLQCRDFPYKGSTGSDPGSIWDEGGVEALKLAFGRM